MTLAYSIFLFALASFFFIWAFNISFVAHIQEESKRVFEMHVWSYILTLGAVALIVIGILQIGV